MDFGFKQFHRMKFELLPNEIFIECFQYLNASDLFHSFDQLNHHFSKLIRTNRLHLNVNQMNKSVFHQFCQIILSNVEIKQNIIYLKLSNKDTSDQIESFVSLIPLNELIHLRSLSLTGLTENNVQQLLPMIPFLSDLHYFSVCELHTDISQIISSLPKKHLRILSVTCMRFSAASLNQAIGLTSLTILSNSLYDLFQLFKYVPMLNYLKIQTFEKRSSVKNESKLMTEDAVHLKEFIIDDCAVSFGDICEGATANFEALEVLLKHMPNLKSLSVRFTWSDWDLYDATRWENLLKSSLQHLSVFKFYFSFYYMPEVDDEYYDLKKFQSDFWLKRHWYTIFEGSYNSPLVYTISYIDNAYTLTPDKIRCNNSLIDESKVFNNFKELTLYPTSITEKSEYYFRNVESLILRPIYDTDENEFKINHIKLIDTMVQLSNIKHLTIDQECHIRSSVFLHLIKKLASLSSLRIDDNKLRTYFQNAQLCGYLKKRIVKLDVFAECDDIYIESNEMIIPSCKVFSNVEQLTLPDMKSVDDLLLILAHCSKLSILNIENISEQVESWIEVNGSTINIRLNYKSIGDYD